MRDIVITGLGVVSPIGIGREAFWDSLMAGRSGVRPISLYPPGSLAVQYGGEVQGFDPKQYVRPRKSLKVMSRDIQLAMCAAELAIEDGRGTESVVDPERFGVVFGSDMIYCDPYELAGVFRECMANGQFDFSRWGEGALHELFPLWLLKYLPNMPACHVGIAHDARGPTNSIILGDVSSLLAIAEGVRVIERDAADVMLVGGSSSRLHPNCFTVRTRQDFSRFDGDPREACRPFDAYRDGMIFGEGAAAFLLESRRHAERRGAKILCSVVGSSSAFQPGVNGRSTPRGATAVSIAGALRSAGMSPADVGHVNAHGLSTQPADMAEAGAIHECLGDTPVTAPKSFFGNLGASSGAVEMAASVLALAEGRIPATLNYQQPDPKCPVNVVHGEPAKVDRPTALVLNQAQTGQAAAIVLAGEE